MDERRRSLLRAASALLLAAQFLNVAPALAAAAPAKPAATAPKAGNLVGRAQGYYRDARYDEAVGLLAGPILRKELAGEELREARLVLARCYVKKGITARAREYFGAILAAEPGWSPEASKLDDEELAVFNAVKGVAPPAAAAAPPAKGAPAGKGTPDTKPAPATAGPDKPTLHKPEIKAAGATQPSWLARNKFLALGLVVGGGVVAGLALSGGSDSSPPAGPASLPGFPSVPGGH